jgi:hypothetical protein
MADMEKTPSLTLSSAWTGGAKTAAKQNTLNKTRALFIGSLLILIGIDLL